MAISLAQLQETLRRPLFIPLCFRLALRLEQVEWEEFVHDPGLASFALRGTRQLFGADAMVNWFDGWMEAEAAGVDLERDAFGAVVGAPEPLSGPPDGEAFLTSEPVRFVLDLTARLCREIGDGATVLGYLTGGSSLLSRLYGDRRRNQMVADIGAGKLSDGDKELVAGAARLTSALADEYCKGGVGALLLAEEDEVDGFDYLKAFDSLFNLASYYGVPVILLSRSPLGQDLRDAARQAGAGHVVACGEANGESCAFPLAMLGQENPDAAAWIQEQPAVTRNMMYFSEWEVPVDAAPEALIALQKQIAAGVG